jgi:hypothetical protein
MKDLFKHKAEREKLDKDYLLLDEFKGFQPAKKLIEVVVSEIDDKDGNFIQQFQTTGFDARLWELFLYSLFKENEFEILSDCDRPDFHLKKMQTELFVEASVSNEKVDDIYSAEFIKEALALNDIAIQNELVDYYIIRLGSVLFSKLNKKYWELAWVTGKPLVLAITPFHNYIADFLPDSKIIEYLYGISYKTEIRESGLELKEIKKLDTHRYKSKEIPSNFFNQENVENISAVIFTNNCNLHKFNRMGFQKGNGDNDIIIVRSGIAYDSTPKSSGKEFDQVVKLGEGNEDWSESVSVFHNPNAMHKINKEVFNGMRQLWLNDNGELVGNTPDNFVYNSLTVTAINE